MVAAHDSCLARAGTPRRPEDVVQHTLIGDDRDDTVLRGFTALGLSLAREQFVLRTDSQVADGSLVAAW